MARDQGTGVGADHSPATTTHSIDCGLPLDAGLLQRLERLRLGHRRRIAGATAGERRSQRRGQSFDFADYRSYSFGDDPRQVDWNIYSRSGQLFVKQFEDEEVLTVHLLLDVSRSMDWGAPNKLDAARRIAAAFGHVALGGHDRVYCTPLAEGIGAPYGPAWGRERSPDLSTMLRRLAAGRAGNLDAALAAHAARFRFAGLVVLISDLLDPSWEAALRRLAGRRHKVVLIHLLAPAEIDPPVGDDVRLLDRESGAAVEVHLDAVAVELYGRRFAQWTGQIERLCERHRMSYLRLPSDAPLEGFFFETLRRHGVVE